MLKLILILALSFAGLVFLSSGLSLSYGEILVIQNSAILRAYVSWLNTAAATSSFSADPYFWRDFALRAPFLALHILNATLLYALARTQLKRVGDALWCVAIFCLLPGANALAVLVLPHSLTLTFALVFCLSLKGGKLTPLSLLALGVMSVSGAAFALLFFALIFYSIARRHTAAIALALGLFALNMYLFDLGINGRPSGHFANVIGQLALIFSPLVLAYFLYVLWRGARASERPFSWFLALVTLVFILALSLRQQVSLESFAPLLLPALPLMVRAFFGGLRVRLPQFQRRYRRPFRAAFAALLLTSTTLYAAKPLYLAMDFDSHFARRHYFVRELAFELRNAGLSQVRTHTRLQKGLAFYGIDFGGAVLSQTPVKHGKVVAVKYGGKTIKRYFVGDN